MSSDQDHLKETNTEDRFAFKNEHKAAVTAEKGLNEETIRLMSEDKDEPDWMLERRLRSLEVFQEMPMPTDWPAMPDLSEVDINKIVPYIRPDVELREGTDDWENLPDVTSAFVYSTTSSPRSLTSPDTSVCCSSSTSPRM